jgi:transposase
VDEFTCPSCASDDVRGERSGGVILLTCQACQTTWPRVPKPSCVRCASSDVEEYGREEWVYDDPAADTKDPAASGTFAAGRTFRCRKCHHTWGSAS